ncbi:type II toxin-antitoxin system RelE/ParE family toxin [Luteibacter sp. ME-Dv--P-043b]|uniref:type II toxin-antitoxin system RelE/ParE family toxin n=1 Tax=Luteibacter sp. ME-Dv--P-043b TaxID=3040291 RepID=UPI0025561054|nr:type II toxin-antitoxin system RelE/ParE family toxin [Luteibacter sp. ME-Dv--P-043b]
MYEIAESETFRRWLSSLRDRSAVTRIDVRLRRLSLGYLDDVKHVGEGVRETRIDHGPGYRVYFIQRSGVLIVLLCGGDKTSQQRDIRKATALAASWDKQACKKNSLAGIRSSASSPRRITWLISTPAWTTIRVMAASFVPRWAISPGRVA